MMMLKQNSQTLIIQTYFPLKNKGQLQVASGLRLHRRPSRLMKMKAASYLNLAFIASGTCIVSKYESLLVILFYSSYQNASH